MTAPANCIAASESEKDGAIFGRIVHVDVVLQQRVERLNARIVARGADSSHRTEEPVVLRHHDEVPA